MTRLRPGDYIVIAVVLAAAVFGLIPKGNGGKALLYSNGVVVKEFDLSKDETYVFEGKYKNEIIVENGTIRISSADCPDKVCVHTGKISKSGQTICCLPNKLFIRIAGKSTETDVISG